MSDENIIPYNVSSWSMRLDEIIGNYNQKISLDSDGNIIVRTGNAKRITVSSSGDVTIEGGLNYNNETNILTVKTFNGDLAGTSTNAANIVVNPSSGDASFYPTFVSTTTGNLPPLVDTQLSYNPSSNTLTVPNINVSSTIQSGSSSLVKIVSGTVIYSFSSEQKTHIITMPTGCTCFNLVSFQPVTTGNNTLHIYNWAVGVWNGIQTQNEVKITAQLANSNNSDPVTLRFYWTI